MAINGTYYCQDLNSTLIINNPGNMPGGTFSGSFELDDITIGINATMNPEMIEGMQVTDFWFGGNTINPNEFVGGAGMQNMDQPNALQVAGAYPTAEGVSTFDGEYLLQ